MTQWTGEVQLVDPKGQMITHGEASLESSGGGWTGTMSTTVPAMAPDGTSSGDGVLRLSTGAEAEIAWDADVDVTAEADDEVWKVTFEGKGGPPPWE